jgi:predicted O-methyltransferase YrrM
MVPNLVSGGILVADNVVSHKSDLEEMLAKAEVDERVDSVIVPIGRGVLVCRKI